MTTPQTYIGLDISLTRTGLVALTPGLPPLVRSIAIKRVGGTLANRGDRLDALAASVAACVPEGAAIAVEGPSFGSTGQHTMGGVWYTVVLALHRRGHLILEVPPTNLKKYATGVGNASKDTVLAAVVRAYPDIEVSNNDEADALVCAAIAARTHGAPLEKSLAKVKLEALAKLEFPAGWAS